MENFIFCAVFKIEWNRSTLLVYLELFSEFLLSVWYLQMKTKLKDDKGDKGFVG